jgi:hypothetical protein
VFTHGTFFQCKQQHPATSSFVLVQLLDGNKADIKVLTPFLMSHAAPSTIAHCHWMCLFTAPLTPSASLHRTGIACCISSTHACRLMYLPLTPVLPSASLHRTRVAFCTSSWLSCHLLYLKLAVGSPSVPQVGCRVTFCISSWLSCRLMYLELAVVQQTSSPVAVVPKCYQPCNVNADAPPLLLARTPPDQAGEESRCHQSGVDQALPVRSE